MSKALRPIRILLALTLGLAAFATAAPAYADVAPPYNNTPTLTVDSSVVHACDVVMVTGTNFPPNTLVTLTANGTVIGTTTSDANGAFSFPWNTCGAALGTYTVTATGGATVLSVTVSVVGGTTTIPTGNLPVTGTDSTTGLARAGAALVAVGALLVLVARRRFQTAAA